MMVSTRRSADLAEIPSAQDSDKKMEHNGDITTVEDFPNRPLKKAKYTESSALDDSLPSASMVSECSESSASMVSECSESTGSESSDLLPLSPSPTMSTLSPFSELMNEETISTEDEQTVPADDDKQPYKDNPLPLPPSSTMSTVVSGLMNEETISTEDEQTVPADDDKQPDKDNPLPLPPSSTMSTVVSGFMNEETISTDDDKQPEAKHIINNITYDFLPQDYTLTEQDECAHCVILYSSEEDILVQIDDITVKQCSLACLLDKTKWLDDEVINAYVCCMKDQQHVQNQNDAKVYFENPLVTRLLKRDGEIGIDGPTGMTKVVKNYLNHDMIHLPINIKDSHWYLACLNVEKHEIQVLDSLCWESNRADLTITLQGLQYHLDIIKSQEDLSDYNWKDLDEWTITEQLQMPIQEDSSSCGLFMLKLMESWNGHTLSHPITQEMITSFRLKLAAILLCWIRNTAPATIEEIDDTQVDHDFIMSDSPIDQDQSVQLNTLSVEIKYQSLLSELSNLSLHELVAGLCNYIKSINSAEALEKVWIQSSQPYPISLTLKKLQEILTDELPMDRDCFNLIVRKIMFDDIQRVKKGRGSISKHYLDMQFWTITDFGRHPNFRKRIDAEQLAYSVRSWPGIKYSVSSCKSIHIPIQNSREFILFILDKDTRTVYILDPTVTDPIYKRNPLAKYVQRLLWISEYLPKAMLKACPESTWNENIFLWSQQIVHDIPIDNRELSGYLVPLFMSTWEDEQVNLPFFKDGYEVRKNILGQLLAFKENECEDNMPAGVLDFISCIRKIQTNMNVKTQGSKIRNQYQ